MGTQASEKDFVFILGAVALLAHAAHPHTLKRNAALEHLNLGERVVQL